MAWSNVRNPRGTFPRSFAECRAILTDRKGRPIHERKIANNTTLRALLDTHGRVRAYALRLHATDIITFLPNGTRVLDSGGWQTATTRERMRACGVDVGMGGGVASLHDSKRGSVAYRDGCRVLADGTVRGDGGPHAEALRVHRAALRRDPLAWRWQCRQGGHVAGGNAPAADPVKRRAILRTLKRDAGPLRNVRRAGLALGRRVYGLGFGPTVNSDYVCPETGDRYTVSLALESWGRLALSFGCETMTPQAWLDNAADLARKHEPDRAAVFAAYTRAIAEGVIAAAQDAQRERTEREDAAENAASAAAGTIPPECQRYGCGDVVPECAHRRAARELKSPPGPSDS